MKKLILIVLLLAVGAVAQDKGKPEDALTHSTSSNIVLTHQPTILKPAEIVKRVLKDGVKDFVEDGLQYQFVAGEESDVQKIYTLVVSDSASKYGTIWDPCFQLWIYEGYDPRETHWVYRIELKSLPRK